MKLKQKEPAITDKHIAKLKDPMLLLNVAKEVRKRGVIGNQHVVVSITLVTYLRLCKNAKPTSGNLLLSSLSGTGKDKLVREVLDTIGKNNITYIHRTGLSDKIFRYWNKPPEQDSWNSLIMYLEDPEEDLLNGQTFRTIASGNIETTTVKDQEVLNIRIEGKPIFIVTSMNTTINLEGSRRWCGLPTDTGDKINKAIQEQKIENELIQESFDTTLNEALIYGLKSYKVVIPKIRVLKGYLEPSTVNNTLIDSLKDYIRASAIIHQYQRETDKKGNLIANDDDIFNGLFVFEVLNQSKGGLVSFLENDILVLLASSSKSKPLLKREILETYPKMYEGRGLSDYKLKKILSDLQEKGRVFETHQFDDLSNRLQPAYSNSSVIKNNSKNNSSVIKNKNHLITNLNTKHMVSNKNHKIDLNTKLMVSNKALMVFEGLLRASSNDHCTMSTYVRFLNSLITKALIICSVIKWCLITKTDLITKNEELGPKKTFDFDEDDI